MKYLKRFFENETTPVNGASKSFRFKNLPHVGDPIEGDGKISIFQQDWFEKLLPDNLKIVSDQKFKKLNPDQSITDSDGTNEFTFDKNECTIQGDLVQFTYYYNAMRKDDGAVSDGEPSMLEFDIHFVKNTRGIKLLVDITYGDQMAVEFSIEAPNKINIIHYNGIGSKFDSETHWGFKKESIDHLVKFFNSFSHGINITAQDLSFIDEHLDSYEHDIDNKDHYYTDDSKLMPWGNSMKESNLNKVFMVLNNSKPPENKYLSKVLKYLDFRNIPYVVASSGKEVIDFNNNYDIVGAISTGSDFRVSEPESETESEVSETGLRILKCPIIAFCYGFQSMAKFYGSRIVGSRLTDEVTTLDFYDEGHFLFSGINLYEQEITFCFHDFPQNLPNGFKKIAEIHGKIAGISSDNRYGILFHPEELPETFIILDNFIKHCNFKSEKTLSQLQTFESFSKKYKIN